MPAQPNYLLIESDSQLAELLPLWLAQPWIVLDTEFVRTNTFYPKPGLVQIASAAGLHLIDPLRLSDLSPLISLLGASQVIKVAHACSEDLELFKSWLGLLPEPLFDTQIAAAFLGHGLQLGYKNLIEQEFQIVLPKTEQRSDWTARPLTAAQLEYAALDVLYLLDLYPHLLAQLQQSGKLAWVQEECRNLSAKINQGKAEPELYLEVKGGTSLTPADMPLLQALACWREQRARGANLPRGFVLRDAVMVELARHKPRSRAELGAIREIQPVTLRKHGDSLLALIAQARTGAGALPMPQGPLPKALKPLANQLKEWVVSQAQRLQIAPELLLNRKTQTGLLYALLAGDLDWLQRQLSPWKIQALGPVLPELIENLGASLTALGTDKTSAQFIEFSNSAAGLDS